MDSLIVGGVAGAFGGYGARFFLGSLYPDTIDPANATAILPQNIPAVNCTATTLTITPSIIETVTKTITTPAVSVSYKWSTATSIQSKTVTATNWATTTETATSTETSTSTSTETSTATISHTSTETATIDVTKTITDTSIEQMAIEVPTTLWATATSTETESATITETSWALAAEEFTTTASFTTTITTTELLRPTETVTRFREIPHGSSHQHQGKPTFNLPKDGRRSMIGAEKTWRQNILQLVIFGALIVAFVSGIVYLLSIYAGDEDKPEAGNDSDAVDGDDDPNDDDGDDVDAPLNGTINHAPQQNQHSQSSQRCARSKCTVVDCKNFSQYGPEEKAFNEAVLEAYMSPTGQHPIAGTQAVIYRMREAFQDITDCPSREDLASKIASTIAADAQHLQQESIRLTPCEHQSEVLAWLGTPHLNIAELQIASSTQNAMLSTEQVFVHNSELTGREKRLSSIEETLKLAADCSDCRSAPPVMARAELEGDEAPSMEIPNEVSSVHPAVGAGEAAQQPLASQGSSKAMSAALKDISEPLLNSLSPITAKKHASTETEVGHNDRAEVSPQILGGTELPGSSLNPDETISEPRESKKKSSRRSRRTKNASRDVPKPQDGPIEAVQNTHTTSRGRKPTPRDNAESATLPPSQPVDLTESPKLSSDLSVPADARELTSQTGTNKVMDHAGIPALQSSKVQSSVPNEDNSLAENLSPEQTIQSDGLPGSAATMTGGAAHDAPKSQADALQHPQHRVDGSPSTSEAPHLPSVAPGDGISSQTAGTAANNVEPSPVAAATEPTQPIADSTVPLFADDYHWLVGDQGEALLNQRFPGGSFRKIETSPSGAHCGADAASKSLEAQFPKVPYISAQDIIYAFRSDKVRALLSNRAYDNDNWLHDEQIADLIFLYAREHGLPLSTGVVHVRSDRPGREVYVLTPVVRGDSPSTGPHSPEHIVWLLNESSILDAKDLTDQYIDEHKGQLTIAHDEDWMAAGLPGPRTRYRSSHWSAIGPKIEGTPARPPLGTAAVVDPAPGSLQGSSGPQPSAQLGRGTTDDSQSRQLTNPDPGNQQQTAHQPQEQDTAPPSTAHPPQNLQVYPGVQANLISQKQPPTPMQWGTTPSNNSGMAPAAQLGSGNDSTSFGSTTVPADVDMVDENERSNASRNDQPGSVTRPVSQTNVSASKAVSGQPQSNAGTGIPPALTTVVGVDHMEGVTQNKVIGNDDDIMDISEPPVPPPEPTSVPPVIGTQWSANAQTQPHKTPATSLKSSTLSTPAKLSAPLPPPVAPIAPTGTPPSLPTNPFAGLKPLANTVAPLPAPVISNSPIPRPRTNSGPSAPVQPATVKPSPSPGLGLQQPPPTPSQQPISSPPKNSTPIQTSPQKGMIAASPIIQAPKPNIEVANQPDDVKERIRRHASNMYSDVHGALAPGAVFNDNGKDLNSVAAIDWSGMPKLGCESDVKNTVLTSLNLVDAWDSIARRMPPIKGNELLQTYGNQVWEIANDCLKDDWGYRSSTRELEEVASYLRVKFAWAHVAFGQYRCKDALQRLAENLSKSEVAAYKGYLGEYDTLDEFMRQWSSALDILMNTDAKTFEQRQLLINSVTEKQHDIMISLIGTVKALDILDDEVHKRINSLAGSGSTKPQVGGKRKKRNADQWGEMLDEQRRGAAKMAAGKTAASGQEATDVKVKKQLAAMDAQAEANRRAAEDWFKNLEPDEKAATKKPAAKDDPKPDDDESDLSSVDDKVIESGDPGKSNNDDDQGDNKADMTDGSCSGGAIDVNMGGVNQDNDDPRLDNVQPGQNNVKSGQGNDKVDKVDDPCDVDAVELKNNEAEQDNSQVKVVVDPCSVEAIDWKSLCRVKSVTEAKIAIETQFNLEAAARNFAYKMHDDATEQTLLRIQSRLKDFEERSLAEDPSWLPDVDEDLEKFDRELRYHYLRLRATSGNLQCTGYLNTGGLTEEERDDFQSYRGRFESVEQMIVEDWREMLDDLNDATTYEEEVELLDQIRLGQQTYWLSLLDAERDFDKLDEIVTDRLNQAYANELPDADPDEPIMDDEDKIKAGAEQLLSEADMMAEESKRAAEEAQARLVDTDDMKPDFAFFARQKRPQRRESLSRKLPNWPSTDRREESQSVGRDGPTSSSHGDDMKGDQQAAEETSQPVTTLTQPAEDGYIDDEMDEQAWKWHVNDEY